MDKYDAFYDFLLFLQVFLLLLTFSIHMYGVFLFKINARIYDSLLKDFGSKGLQLDIITSISTHFGSFLNELKIMYFTRLYYGKAWYYKKNEVVSAETYQFVQELPKDKIGWIIKLHRVNMFAFGMAGLFVVVALIWRFLYF
ncbi:hypothetical protein [Pantoea sp. App145]|uniref:hypothetical protein n=1 Tax=Pantoea sp. App145 TaxID=3071567 RepID=UPI003A8136CF